MFAIDPAGTIEKEIEGVKVKFPVLSARRYFEVTSKSSLLGNFTNREDLEKFIEDYESLARELILDWKGLKTKEGKEVAYDPAKIIDILGYKNVNKLILEAVLVNQVSEEQEKN